ncbi:MAG: DNA polymerase III subunit gamma/tau [Saprospiraceae bacterium]|nr:DNA polymerase III subunit gamma/tau [Saprospiraceae bacterium]
MSNFIVSARKYRPQRFEDVVGQQHVAGTLRNALATDHLAHAFLFTGPRGVGKTTCARILAKVINCENRSVSQDACNQCPSCKAFNENASFNIIELDAASNNSVDHIRALIEQVRFPPQQGRYKVFIIDEVHMLSNQAFNAFLKTLEEPPPYAIFILATTEKHKIIPTILSRCQIFDFRRIAVPDMVLHLQHICAQEGITAEEDALHIIGQKADGALRDALSIFDRITSAAGKQIRYADVIEQLNVLDYDYYFTATDALMAEDLPAVFNLFDQVLTKGFEPDLFLNGLAEHLRNLLVCQDESTLALLEVGDSLRERYRKQAELSSPSFLISGLSLANDCDVHLKTARNKRLHVELGLVKMCFTNRAITLASAPAPEKKTPDGSVNPSNGHQPAPKPAPAPANATPLDPNEVAALKQNLKQGIQKAERIPLRLDAFEQAVAVEEAHKAGLESRLTLENARSEWLQYADKQESPTLRQAFAAAELHLDQKTLHVRVGLNLQKNALQQESIKLLDTLRQQLHDPQIRISIEVDESRAPQEPPKPTRPLTPHEKIENMKNNNPLVADLIERLGLKILD